MGIHPKNAEANKQQKVKIMSKPYSNAFLIYFQIFLGFCGGRGNKFAL